MSTCLYLLWRWLEFEWNQWTYRSAATPSDLCENNFESAPRPGLEPIAMSRADFSTVLTTSLSSWKPEPCTQMLPSHTLSTSLLTLLLSVSAGSTEEHFRWATCKTNLMLHPVERPGSLFALNYSVRNLAERCQSSGISDNIQGQFN